jgi:hypothetical protein
VATPSEVGGKMNVLGGKKKFFLHSTNQKL